MTKNQIIERFEEQFKSDIFLKRKDGIADQFIETKLEYILDFLRANLPSTVSQRRTLDKEQIIEKFGKQFQTFNNDYQEVWKKDVLPRDIVDWLSQNLLSITDGECKQCDEFDKKLAEQQRINNEVLADKCDELNKFATKFSQPVVEEKEIIKVLETFITNILWHHDKEGWNENVEIIFSSRFSQLAKAIINSRRMGTSHDEKNKEESD